MPSTFKFEDLLLPRIAPGAVHIEIFSIAECQHICYHHEGLHKELVHPGSQTWFLNVSIMFVNKVPKSCAHCSKESLSMSAFIILMGILENSTKICSGICAPTKIVFKHALPAPKSASSTFTCASFFQYHPGTEHRIYFFLCRLCDGWKVSRDLITTGLFLLQTFHWYLLCGFVNLRY